MDESAPLQALEEHAVEEIERRMLGIWQKLFPRTAIAGDSNFFDLGGDSLLLVRLQSLLAKEFNLRLTMADVTRHYTFAGLVDWTRNSPSRTDRPEATAAELDPAVLSLQSGGSGSPVFIIPQMLIFRTLAEELGSEQPFYALQVPDEEVPDELTSVSFEELRDFTVSTSGSCSLRGRTVWGMVPLGLDGI